MHKLIYKAVSLLLSSLHIMSSVSVGMLLSFDLNGMVNNSFNQHSKVTQQFVYVLNTGTVSSPHLKEVLDPDAIINQQSMKKTHKLNIANSQTIREVQDLNMIANNNQPNRKRFCKDQSDTKAMRCKLRCTISSPYIAAWRGQGDLLKAMIRHRNFNINDKNSDGGTVLYFAVQSGHFGVCKMLIELGANVNVLTNAGTSLLYIAAQQGYADITELLLNNGADIDAPSFNGYSALHVACLQRCTDVVKILLEHKVDVNIKTKYGITPLFFAVEQGCMDIANLLLDAGADVNVAMTDEEDIVITPLYVAWQVGNSDMVSFLIKRGANMEAIPDLKKVALECATRRRS